jgi:acyl carrier protein
MADSKAGGNDVVSVVKDYILNEFLPGTDASELANDTPLITGGVLDSLATLKLVSFLEENYGIRIQAHEVSVDYLNTLQDIDRLVSSKRR